MIVDLYMDVFEGAKPEHLMAMATVGKKSEGFRRYRISVRVPDEALTGKLDGVLPVEDVVEVDK